MSQVAAAQSGGGGGAPEEGVEPTPFDLQRQIDELEARLDETPRTGGSANTMELFGRIHLDAWTFPSSDPGINVLENGDPGQDPVSNLEFRRARMGVSGEIHAGMFYKIELDFGKPDALRFKDLYFGFSDVSTLQTLLIGNQKRPYGLDTLNSSRYNVFMERPFIVEALNVEARRFGVAAYGVSQDLGWNWRYGTYLLEDWSGSGEVATDKMQPEIAGRLARSAWYEDGGRNYGHVALSGAIAWPDDTTDGSRFGTRPEARSQSRWLDTGMIAGADNYALAGLEAVGNFGPTQITAELMDAYVNRASGMEDVNFFGGYLYLSHFLTRDYMPWDRKSGTLGRPRPARPLGEAGGWGAWQLAARYSYADFTDEDIFGGVGSAVTLGLNWYWNDHAGVQLNYIKGDIDDRQVASGGTTYAGGDYEVIGIRFRVDF